MDPLNISRVPCIIHITPIVTETMGEERISAIRRYKSSNILIAPKIMKKIRTNTKDSNFIDSAPRNTSIPAPNKPIAKEKKVPNLKSLIGLKINTIPRIPKQTIVIHFPIPSILFRKGPVQVSHLGTLVKPFL